MGTALTLSDRGQYPPEPMPSLPNGSRVSGGDLGIKHSPQFNNSYATALKHLP